MDLRSNDSEHTGNHNQSAIAEHYACWPKYQVQTLCSATAYTIVTVVSLELFILVDQLGAEMRIKTPKLRVEAASLKNLRIAAKLPPVTTALPAS